MEAAHEHRGSAIARSARRCETLNDWIVIEQEAHVGRTRLEVDAVRRDRDTRVPTLHRWKRRRTRDPSAVGIRIEHRHCERAKGAAGLGGYGAIGDERGTVNRHSGAPVDWPTRRLDSDDLDHRLVVKGEVERRQLRRLKSGQPGGLLSIERERNIPNAADGTAGRERAHAPCVGALQ